MAKKENMKNEVAKAEKVEGELYSAEECRRYANFDARVNNALKMADRSMIELGGALAVIKNEHLYKVDGYKSIGAYATERFGISKATVSDAINTFVEFGDVTTGDIREEFLDYTFSQLKLMRRLPESARLEVTPDTTAREIQQMINAHNAKLEAHSKDDEVETENNAEERPTDSAADEPKVTNVEDSGNTEPYIELIYSMSEYVEMDAEVLKALLIENFKKGLKVVLNYKFD